MRRFKKITSCIAIGTLSAMMLATASMAATTETETSTAGVEEQNQEAVSRDVVEMMNEIALKNKAEKEKALKERLVVKDPNVLQDETLRAIADMNLPYGYTVIDLSVFKELTGDDYGWLDKYVSNGIALVHPEGNYTTYVGKADDDDWEELKAKLDPYIWESRDVFVFWSYYPNGNIHGHIIYEPGEGTLSFTEFKDGCYFD